MEDETIDYRDAATLKAMAQEWIDKLIGFAAVYELAKPRMLLCKSRLLLLTNQPSAGLRCARKALEAATSMGMPYDAALAKCFLATHGPPREMGRWRAEADETLTALGVTSRDAIL